MILTSLFVAACSVENRNFQITVVNPDPEAARLFLTSPDGEAEVTGAWSKSFFREARVDLRAELIPGQRTVFLGWKRGYPLNGIDGSFVDESFSSEDSLSANVDASTYVVSPRAQWVANEDPRWIGPDRIIFRSNRDGGEGIWTIDPEEGPATRLTAPELDENGAPAIAHRLDVNRISGAWRGSPLIAVCRGTLPSPISVPEVQTVYDADSGRSWRIGAELFGVEEIEIYPHRFMNGEGRLVWLARTGSEYEKRMLFCVFSPGAEPVVIGTQESEGFKCGAAGPARYIFIRSYETIAGEYMFTRLWILDSGSGLLAEATGLRKSSGFITSIHHHPVAISADGSGLLLSIDTMDGEDAPLGSSLALVGSDGSVAFLPPASGYLEIEGDSFRFSADGSSLIGRSLAGAWGRYSPSDGSLLEALPERPADLSPSWQDAIYALEQGDPYAADGDEPGGLRSAESAAAGRNKDLIIHEPSVADRWLTGPESGDAE